jgi:hypothetical protein
VKCAAYSEYTHNNGFFFFICHYTYFTITEGPVMLRKTEE